MFQCLQQHPSDAPECVRELALRESNGVRVRLLWRPADDAVTVAVTDERLGDAFEFAAAPDRALDAFHHPYAYAARRVCAPIPTTALTL